jgi:hypothetical protein
METVVLSSQKNSTRVSQEKSATDYKNFYDEIKKDVKTVNQIFILISQVYMILNESIPESILKMKEKITVALRIY